MAATLFSVGHSTRSSEELIDVLRAAGVELLADVRRHPGSRWNPQFNKRRLEGDLASAGIAYLWLGESLGGRREQVVPAEQSPNRALREEAFRHYADAMTTREFEAGFAELRTRAAERPTAVMCAERDWQSCHRQLIADLWCARGGEVVHLIRAGERETHRLTAFARVSDGAVTYPTLL